MPEYSQIQTYIKCNKEILFEAGSTIKKLYLACGLSQGYIDQYIDLLNWEEAEDGIVYFGGTGEAQTIQSGKDKYRVKPHLIAWTPNVISELSESWLEISLLFETEEIISDYEKYELKETAKMLIWELMNTFAEFFSETGVYFTDEVSDGRPQESIWGSINDFWNCDAAIIPSFLSSYYQSNPVEWIINRENNVIKMVRRMMWLMKPW